MDSETFGTIESRMETACSLRDLTGAVVVMTGVEDVVAGKEKKFIVRNGHPWMARITGSGCMLDGLMGSVLRSVWGTGTGRSDRGGCGHGSQRTRALRRTGGRRDCKAGRRDRHIPHVSAG